MIAHNWIRSFAIFAAFAGSSQAQMTAVADSVYTEIATGPSFSPSKYRILRISLLPSPVDAQ